MTITLNEVKDYLSVDRDFKGDDEMLLGILEASVDAIQRHINREFAPEEGMPPAVLPVTYVEKVLLPAVKSSTQLLTEPIIWAALPVLPILRA